MTEHFEFPEGFEKLADDRKEKGFSVIQFAIGFPCDIEPFDPRGSNAAGDPWDKDMQSINPAYFDLADQRFQMLLDKGFMPNMVGLWGYYMKFFGPENIKKTLGVPDCPLWGLSHYLHFERRDDAGLLSQSENRLGQV
jgi:hypothetical protein